MKSLNLFLTLSILSYSAFCSLPKCPKYSDKLGENICSQFSITNDMVTLFLKPCSSGHYCHYEFPEKGEKCSDTPLKKYPGVHCSKNDECFSGECNDVCIQKNATTCTSHAQCPIGQFCGDEQKCHDLVTVGNQCSPKFPCHVNLVCNNKICTKLGSIDDGQDATAPAACKSFYIGPDNKCQAGPKLKGDSKKCSESMTECIYIAGDKELKTPCKCGVTTEGTSYCNPGVGNRKVSLYFDYVNKLPENKCHIMSGPLCLHKALKDMDSSYYDAFVEYSEMLNWELYEENPENVKKTVHTTYWTSRDLRDSDTPSSAFGFTMLLIVSAVTIVLSVVIILICKCKKGSSDEEETLASA